MTMSHPILHVVVVGFNHKRGCQVDFVYPPFQSGDSSQDADANVPEAWANLPSLAIPDGAHNSTNGDLVYFVLPSLEERNRAVFGVACYRQIETASLEAKEEDVTRSFVQKSVCVLSRVPLYGILTSKLELITQAYFNEKDFSKVQVLEQMHRNLCDVFDYKTLDQQSLYMGIPLEPLLRSFGHRTLELFKLVLLERRVIFEVYPTSLLSDLVVGLVSLFPCLLEKGLEEAATYRPADASQEQQDQKTKSPVLAPNEYGFPLSIFTKGNLFHPYLSLQCIDNLRSNSVRAYCIGVTNSIFRNNSDLHDVYITIDKNGVGSIYYSDADLEKQLALSTQDMRFMQNILKAAEGARQNPAVFDGNDDWVRAQFYSYLCSLFRAAQLKDENLADYNSEFVKSWSVTHNFRTWSRGNYDKLNDFQSVHPSAGRINAQDILMLVGHRFGNFGQRQRLANTLSTSAKYMGEQANRLHSTFASWIGRGQSNDKNGSNASH